MILLTTRQRGKPYRFAPRLNRNNRFGASPHLALALNEGRGSAMIWDAAARLYGVYAGPAPLPPPLWKPGPDGWEFWQDWNSTNYTSSSRIVFPAGRYDMAAGSDWTFIWRGQFKTLSATDSTPANRLIFGLPNGGWFGFINSSGVSRFRINWGGFIQTLLTHDFGFLNRRHCSAVFRVVNEVSAQLSIWDVVAKTLLVEASFAPNWPMVPGAGALIVANFGSATASWGGTLSFVGILPKSVSDADVVSLHLNPWQMFEPDVRLMRAYVGGPGLQTVNLPVIDRAIQLHAPQIDQFAPRRAVRPELIEVTRRNPIERLHSRKAYNHTSEVTIEGGEE